jgi:hypothetical protein
MAHQHDAPHAAPQGAAAHAVHHGTADDEYAFTPVGAGHEHTDASVGLILKFAIWLVVAALVVHVGSKVMFDVMVSQSEPTAPLEFPLAGSTTETRLPAGPRLQRFPATEIYEFRQQERQLLNSYGWVDRNAGTVRIPIDEAMRLTIERGLPARAQAPASADGTAAPAEVPGLLATDASAGRMMERRRQ